MKRFVYPVVTAALLLSTVMAASVFAAGTHSATKKTVTIQLCSSGPYGVGALKDLWQGVRNGVDLATINMKSKLAKVGIKVGPQIRLDDAKPDGSAYSQDVERSNALKCIGTSDAVGYVGTLNSGAALVSEPVLNRAHLVMVSPANTNPELTSVKPYAGAGGRTSQEPLTASHKLPYVTYYRTVTTDALQGPAGALFAQKNLKAKSVYVVDDKLTYGAGLAATFKAEAQKLGVKVLGSGHIDSSSPAGEAQTAQSLSATIKSVNPGMVYCGCDSETTLALPRDLRSAGYSKPYMAGDAIVNTAWITSTKQGSVNNFATSVGPPPSKAGGFFRTLYKKHFGSFYRSPGIQAYDAPAYDAAAVILQAVYEAAKAHQFKGNATQERTVVVKYVHSIHFKGATGTTSFDSNGDTKNRILSVYKVKGSKWSFIKEVQAPKGAKPA